MTPTRYRIIAALLIAGCSSSKKEAPPAPKSEVTADDTARAAGIVGELKKSLMTALTGALTQGAPAAVEACHAMAPGLAASLARDGIVVGRATRKPRNPANEATGWRADALASFEELHAAKTPLAGKTFSRRLPDGRVGYAEPLVIGEVCLTCHGATLAPDVSAVLAAKYPADKATGYALGDLRGVAWVELPAAR